MTASPSSSHHARGVWFMLLSAFSFTVTTLIIRALGAVQSVDVWLLTSLRFAVGLVVVGSFFRTGPDALQPRNLYRNRRLIFRGFGGAIGVYTYYLAVVHLGAGRATFINSTYFAMGAVLAVLVLRERLRPVLAAGGALTIIGLALITNAFGTGAGIGFYDVIAIISALSSAYVVVTIRQLHAEGEHTATIFSAQCVFGLMICATPAAVNWAPTAPLAWLLMILAGLGAAAGQLSMTRSFRDLPVGEGSLLQMLVPLGTAIGGAVFFHEHFLPHELIGAGLILLGSALPAVRKT